MVRLTYEEERRLNENIAIGMLIVSLPTFLLLYYVIPSPWGKTLTSKRQFYFGPLIPSRISWFVFESPNLIWSYFCWRKRRDDVDSVNQILLLLFVIHYIQRDIVFPLIISKNTKPLPLAVVLAAFFYCSVNG